MPNIVSILSDIVTPYKTSSMIIAVIIIFSIVAYFSYNKYVASSVNKNVTSDIANANRRKKEADVLFFSADWCPHCKTARPEWNKFVNKFDGTNVGEYTIKCVDVNCTDPDNPDIQASIQKYGIEHYPTLKMTKDDNIIDFDAKISEESLDKFVNAMLV